MRLCLESAQTLSFTEASVRERVLQVQVWTVEAEDVVSIPTWSIPGWEISGFMSLKERPKILSPWLCSARHHPQQ